MGAVGELMDPEQCADRSHEPGRDEIGEQPATAWSQDPRHLGGAAGLILPVVKRHRAEDEVERSVWKRKVFRGRLPEFDGAIGSRALRELHHLDRGVDTDEPCAGEATSRRFEQLAGAATDIEDGARTANLLRRHLQDRSLNRVEDQALHPVAVVGCRPAVEAVDVVAVSHRLSIIGAWRRHRSPGSIRRT